MLPRRVVARFLCAVVVLYALFMIRWPGLVESYGRVFASTAHFATYRLWGNKPLLGTRAMVQVNYVPDASDPDHDVRIEAANVEQLSGPNDVFTMRTSSRHLGYMPTVVLLALVLASPVPWRRRGMAVLVGMVVVHLFIAIRFIALLLGIFDSDQRHGLYKLGSFGTKTLGLLVDIMAEVPATAYVVPLFIWILVTFRRDDIDRWRGLSASPMKPSILPSRGGGSKKPSP